MRRSGVRIPLAPPQADIRSGCRFLYAWARWCGACCCGPTGVPGACWAGLLGVPVGGGPPASRPRRELRPARRLEARPGPATAHGHRSQALSCPPAPSTPAAPGVLTCGSARRHDARPGPPPPTGTAAGLPVPPAPSAPAAPWWPMWFGVSSRSPVRLSLPPTGIVVGPRRFCNGFQIGSSGSYTDRLSLRG